MSLESDLLLDRRRLKRRLLLWRVVALLAVVGTLLLGMKLDGELPGSGEHIARLNVTGTIAEDRKVLAAIEAMGRDPSARALVIAIDSPGGTVSGGEALHGAIAKVAARKPVVAVMGATAASAGYMIAVPAARIFAREATLTGSIGVKLMLPEFSGLLEKLGVGDNSLASGPLKDEPSLARPMSSAGRTVMRAIVDDLHDQFVAMVAAGRNMPAARVRELADGRAYTGRQALALGLVDAIGGETEARAWLAETYSLPTTLKLRDVGRRGWADRMADGAGLDGALPALLRSLMKTVLSQRLDGAWAIWQPAGEE